MQADRHKTHTMQADRHTDMQAQKPGDKCNAYTQGEPVVWLQLGSEAPKPAPPYRQATDPWVRSLGVIHTVPPPPI